jgi:5-oxoprolinase (ATP-hydrolysing) subunit C
VIEVLATPPLNTLQDLGRPGFRRIGLCQGGAMDEMASRIGNLMAGNEPNAAVLELQTFPVRLRATIDHLIAVTGADAPVRAAGLSVPSYWAMLLGSGQELLVERPRRGARVYVAVAGGFRAPLVLGSRSTDLRSGFGGFEGRDLRSGDVLPVEDAAPFDVELAREGFGIEPPVKALRLPYDDDPGDRRIRVMRGPEHDEFDEPSHNALWNEGWTVTSMSDRMGMRLVGKRKLVRANPYELRSGGILPGVVQVPPSGEPLIQLRDANSAGGYPRIGVVIQADFWRLAQAAPSTRLRLVEVDHDEAVEASRRNGEYVELIRKTMAAYSASPASSPGEVDHAER